MPRKLNIRPEEVAKYAVNEVKVYKAFINYLRHRKLLGEEFSHVAVSSPEVVFNGYASNKFYDIDCFEGLYEYQWNNFPKECEEFRYFMQTVKVGMQKIGVKELSKRFNLDRDKVSIGFKLLKNALKTKPPKFTVAVLEKLTWDVYRELDAKMEQFKREIEEHENLVEEIRAAIEENPELEEQGEAAIHNINQMIDWKQEAYDYLFANS